MLKTLYRSHTSGITPFAKTPVIIIGFTIDASDTEIQSICQKTLVLQDGLTLDESIKPIKNLSRLITQLTMHLVHWPEGCEYYYGCDLKDDHVQLWLEYDQLKASNQALSFVLGMINQLIQEKNTNLVTLKKHTHVFFEKSKASVNLAINGDLFKASKDFDIPSIKFGNLPLYRQFGWGQNSGIFRSSSPIDDSYHGVFISLDKSASKSLLKNLGLPYAKDIVLNNKNQLTKAAEAIGFPCVIKPIRGFQGKGITVGIRNMEQLISAYSYAKSSAFGNNPLMLEQHKQGDTHRIVVINNQFQCTIKKVFPILNGDGKSSIKNLIELINQQRASENMSKGVGLKPIKFTEHLSHFLQQHNLTINSVLEKDQALELNYIFSYFEGSEASDVTNQTHPQIIQMAEVLAKNTNIKVLGIDFITTDISQPLTVTKGVINEYNHTPSFQLANIIQNKALVRQIHEAVFGANLGRIPIDIVIVEKNKFKFCEGLLMDNSENVSIGWVTPDKSQIGSLPIFFDTHKNWNHVHQLLSQKTLSKAIIVCSLEDIMRQGVPVDKANMLIIDQTLKVPQTWQVLFEEIANQIIETSEADLPVIIQNSVQE